MAVLQCLLLVAGLGMAAAQPAGAPVAASAFHLQDISSGTCMDTINGQLTVAVGCNVLSSSKVRSLLHRPFAKRPAVDDRCLPCGRLAFTYLWNLMCRCSSWELMGPWCKARLGFVSHPSTTVSHVAGSTLHRSGLSSTLVPCRLLRSSLHWHQRHSEHREQCAQSLLTATSSDH